MKKKKKSAVRSKPSKASKLKPARRKTVKPVQSKSIPSREAGAFQLPAQYGQTRAALLVRDPWWLFAYWEVTPEIRERMLHRMTRAGTHLQKMVLRVYEMDSDSAVASTFDIDLPDGADRWYVDAGKPDRVFYIEIGAVATSGSFYPLVRSNAVRAPRASLSEALDEKWAPQAGLYPDGFSAWWLRSEALSSR